MEVLRAQLQSPKIAALAGSIVGLVIGWFIIGWGLWPVEWTDAAPADLQQAWKEDYLRMAIDSYSLYPDQQKALMRWQGLGADAEELLAVVEQAPGPYPETVTNFRQAVGAAAAAGVPPEGGEALPGGAGETGEIPLPGEAPAASDTKSGLASSTIILALCGVVAILAMAVAAYFFLFRSRSFPKVLSPAAQAQEITRMAEPTDFSARGELPPMAQFMTTYMLGDDLFDDSFSIDSPSGEFLGECGVGISEPIGVGEPKKVAAFEIWLFDKNDIQTVTKVLMSSHAYQDAALRERLTTKGEPFLAEAGAEMYLETATLRLVARVVDMAYGTDGKAPPNSFFERLTLELAVWQK